MGHIIEHVALELQTLAGMNCGFGRTFSTDDYGVYQVIFNYELESAGLYAGKAAVALIECLANGGSYEHLERDLAELKSLHVAEALGPSTEALVKEAQRRGIPVTRYKDCSLVSLGYGRNQKRIWASVAMNTSMLAADIASDKQLTKSILATNFIQFPKAKLLNHWRN